MNLFEKLQQKEEKRIKEERKTDIAEDIIGMVFSIGAITIIIIIVIAIIKWAFMMVFQQNKQVIFNKFLDKLIYSVQQKIGEL